MSICFKIHRCVGLPVSPSYFCILNFFWRVCCILQNPGKYKNGTFDGIQWPKGGVDFRGFDITGTGIPSKNITDTETLLTVLGAIASIFGLLIGWKKVLFLFKTVRRNYLSCDLFVVVPFELRTSYMHALNKKLSFSKIRINGFLQDHHPINLKAFFNTAQLTF